MVKDPNGCGESFRRIDYTGIMTRVSPGTDPGFFSATQALQNNLYVHPTLEPYHYESGIDWTLNNKTNSWYLWFQSLQIVGYLANAAEASGEGRYLEKAGDIIESWFRFHYRNPSPPVYSWDDHAVANRVRNVTHFLRAYKSLQDVALPDILFREIRAMLEEHATWLLDEKHYAPTNHGMMAAVALTQMALTFPDFDGSRRWLETGLARIRERIRDDLSAEGVHLEHSASYHPFFLDLVLRVDDYLKLKGISLFEAGDKTVQKMKEYLAYLIMPDGHLPAVGDSNSQGIVQAYGHPWLTYSLRKGLEGVRPPANSVVCPSAGVAVLRDGWKSGEEFTGTTYLFFQSGFHSTAHKHADDLGFVLYSRAEHIFVGPGVYGYDKSKYRQYVASAQAHNTLTIDGQSYVLSTDNAGKAGITAYRLEGAFDFVQGSHTMCEGVTLKRGIVFIRPSTVLVIDEALSDASHLVQQIWNLSPAAHDLEFDSGGASFLVGERGVHVEIRQLRPVTGVNHYYGQEEPVRGFISPRQWELVPVHQLEFESHGNGKVFVTQITVTGPGDDVPTIDADLSNLYQDIGVHHSDGTTLIINLESALQS